MYSSNSSLDNRAGLLRISSAIPISSIIGILPSYNTVTLTAKTQAEIEASYSTNANLSALRVVDYVITPDFNKDILEYNLEVENEVESITIKATKASAVKVKFENKEIVSAPVKPMATNILIIKSIIEYLLSDLEQLPKNLILDVPDEGSAFISALISTLSSITFSLISLSSIIFQIISLMLSYMSILFLKCIV